MREIDLALNVRHARGPLVMRAAPHVSDENFVSGRPSRETSQVRLYCSKRLQRALGEQ